MSNPPLKYIIGLLITSVFLLSPTVSAQNFKQLQWPWYIPEAGESSCAGSLVGSTNEARIFNFFLLNKGLSAAQAAGAYGNIMHESGGDPENIQNPGDRTKDPTPLTRDDQGWGIIQWTPGAKIVGLAEKAGVTGPIYELPTQLELVWQHMNNNPVVTQEFDLSYYKTLTDYKAATAYFEDKIEGAGITALTERQQLAFEGLQKYGSNTGGSPLGGTCGGSIIIDPNFTITKLNPPLPTPGGKIDPKGITLHWWGGNSGGEGINRLVRDLQSNPGCISFGGCSVQIGITENGSIYQMTNDLLDLTYHATGGNSTTFGIEIEGTPDEFGAGGVTKYPKKFAAVVATVKYLVATYRLPLTGPVICNDVSGIHPHKEYNNCPGAVAKSDIDDAYFNAVMQAVGS